MRQTSIEAYHKIKDNGLLSKLRFIVYECIFRHQEITQSECWNLLKESHGIKNSSHITPRFAELKNLGVIEEIGTRPCQISGRNCITWSTTGNLPVKFERKSKDVIIKELRAEIERLKKMIPSNDCQELFHYR